MPQIHPKRCEDHRTSYLGQCPFCLAGLEPVRFLEARADFAGLPLAGTVDILPHYPMVDLEDVLGVLGQQLAGLEALEAEAIRPYALAKQVIYQEMRRARIDTRVMQQAVRIHLGVPGADKVPQTPYLLAMVEVLRRGVRHGQ
jgi:hypothetical protein